MHIRGVALLVVVAVVLAGCSSVPVDGGYRDIAEEPPYGQELRDETALYERTGSALRDAGSYTVERSERVTKGGILVREDRTLGRRNLSAGRLLVRQEHPGRTRTTYTDTETDMGPGYRYTRVTYPPGGNGRNRTSRERYEGNLTDPTQYRPVPAPTDAALAAEPLHYDGPATVDGERTYHYVVRNRSWSQVGYSPYARETRIERYRLEVFVRPDGSLALARLTMRVSADGSQYVAVERTRYRGLGETTVTPPPWTEWAGVGMFDVHPAGAGETR